MLVAGDETMRTTAKVLRSLVTLMYHVPRAGMLHSLASIYTRPGFALVPFNASAQFFLIYTTIN